MPKFSFTKIGFSSLSKRKEKEDSRKSDFPEIKIKTWTYDDLYRVEVIRTYKVEHSKIIIGHLKDPPRKVYLVIDPEVSEEELKMLEKVAGELIYVLEGLPDEKEFIKILEKRNIKRPELQYLIIRELSEERFGPLDPLMHDPDLENIECTGVGRPVTVTHNQLGRLETNIVFDSEDELNRLVIKLVNKAGKSISKANPKIDNARLPGGHRLAATFMSEISETSSFVIRKFPKQPWTITKQMVRGTISPEIGAWLWLLIEHKLPVLIVGAMGSGKTSLTNALCGFVPPNKRVGTVEDVPEFNLPVKPQNWQRMFIRESFTLDGKGEISLFDLLKGMLRYQVEYLVVNEIRGEEAKVWFQAISSGHGGITTIHAEDFNSTLARLSDLGIKVSALSSLHGLVYIGVYMLNGERVRRIREIADFRLEEGEPRFDTVFRYVPSEDRYECMSPEKMVKLRSARKIMSISGKIHTEEDFIREYALRREFLEWLYKMAKADKRYLTREFLIGEFEKFYADPTYFRSIEPPKIEIEEEKRESATFVPEVRQGIKIVKIRSLPKNSRRSKKVRVVTIREIKPERREKKRKRRFFGLKF